jgi:putative acetyltransferase
MQTLPPGVLVRDEAPGDAVAIASVNERAFDQPDEARLIEAIRRNGRKSISLVATHADTIVGHILFTPVAFVEGNRGVEAMGLGPMAVLPGWQRRGIGSSLVNAGLERCAAIGCQLVVVVGHPEYYPRFGFEPASAFGLRCEYDVPDDVFMVRVLTPGVSSLAMGCAGTVRYLPEFGSA